MFPSNGNPDERSSHSDEDKEGEGSDDGNESHDDCRKASEQGCRRVPAAPQANGKKDEAQDKDKARPNEFTVLIDVIYHVAIIHKAPFI